MDILVKPYDCRPLDELRTIPINQWTRDESSAFQKFKGYKIDEFINEWESICNQLNPVRKTAHRV